MLVEGDDKTLFRCRVLYIGSAVPLEASKGLEAIQQPLRERYPYKDEKMISGVDAFLSVMPTGIQMQYSASSSSVMWFPVSSLTFCAAVRCINLLTKTNERVPRFVSLDSPAAGGMYRQKPAIFAAITRRTKGRKVLECHSFICGSSADAINLVQSTKMADRAFRNGIVPHNIPLSRMGSVSVRPQNESELHMIQDQKTAPSEISPEFYDSPPTQGYFYGTGSTLVRKYTVEKINRDTLSMGPKTLDRPGYRFNSPVLVPTRSYYVTGPRKMAPVPVHFPQSRRFLSPPPPHAVIRKDPYVYSRLPYPVAQSERTGNRSPSLGRSQRSSESSNTIRPDENSSQKSHGKETAAIKNGRGGDDDDDSLSGSSRPPSPIPDYEPYGSSVSVTKTHLSRKDRHEKGTFVSAAGGVTPSSSVMYPYYPYMYPAEYMPDDSVMRAHLLPPSAIESDYTSSKNKSNTRKKKDKSKKKSKKSTKNDSTDDLEENDDFGYSTDMLNGSDKQGRMMLDRPRAFQNEKAFGLSIAAERKKYQNIDEQENISYKHYSELDLVN